MKKLDLIIDALETGLKLTDGFISEWNQINKALQAARELRALEPDAFMTYKGHLLHALDPTVLEHSEPTPLYALEQSE